MMRRWLATALTLSLFAAPAALAADTDGTAGLLTSWLEVQEDDPATWRQAWLQAEAVNSRVLDQSFYARMTPADKAAAISQALESDMSDFPARMKDLADLQAQWGADVAAVKATMVRELGQGPGVDVHVFFAMSPQKAVAGTIDGRPAVVVNARHLLPYQPDATRLLLTRALLVHASSAWAKDRQETALAPTVAGQLQAEGLTAWAAGRVVPGAAVASVLSVTPAQAQMLEKARGAIARELLTALDSGSPAQLDRFFGAKAPEGWPPATGRYVGLLVTQEVARELGGPAVVRMSRKTFAERARVILKRLATGAASEPKPSAPGTGPQA